MLLGLSGLFALFGSSGLLLNLLELGLTEYWDSTSVFRARVIRVIKGESGD
jgi:hypothetical protein